MPELKVLLAGTDERDLTKLDEYRAIGGYDGVPKARAMTPQAFDTIGDEGPEFTLLMARRMTSGNVVLLGEIPFDNKLMKRAFDRLEEQGHG